MDDVAFIMQLGSSSRAWSQGLVYGKNFFKKYVLAQAEHVFVDVIKSFHFPPTQYYSRYQVPAPWICLNARTHESNRVWAFMSINVYESKWCVNISICIFVYLDISVGADSDFVTTSSLAPCLLHMIVFGAYAWPDRTCYAHVSRC